MASFNLLQVLQSPTPSGPGPWMPYERRSLPRLEPEDVALDLGPGPPATVPEAFDAWPGLDPAARGRVLAALRPPDGLCSLFGLIWDRWRPPLAALQAAAQRAQRRHRDTATACLPLPGGDDPVYLWPGPRARDLLDAVERQCLTEGCAFALPDCCLLLHAPLRDAARRLLDPVRCLGLRPVADNAPAAPDHAPAFVARFFPCLDGWVLGRAAPPGPEEGPVLPLLPEDALNLPTRREAAASPSLAALRAALLAPADPAVPPAERAVLLRLDFGRLRRAAADGAGHAAPDPFDVLHQAVGHPLRHDPGLWARVRAIHEPPPGTGDRHLRPEEYRSLLHAAVRRPPPPPKAGGGGRPEGPASAAPSTWSSPSPGAAG